MIKKSNCFDAPLDIRPQLKYGKNSVEDWAILANFGWNLRKDSGRNRLLD